MTDHRSAAGRAFDRLLWILACVAAAIIVAVTCAILYEVLARYFFNRPSRWVVQFSEYGLVFIGFLACAWVLREEAHVKVEMLTDMLTPPVRARLFAITSWVGAAMCAILAWVSATYTWELYERDEMIFRSIITPKWPMLAVVTLGIGLLAIQFARRAVGGEKRGNPEMF